MSLLKQIVEGHINEFFGVKDKEQQDVFNSRARICASCPLKKANTCNRNKFMDPKTLEVSNTRKAGYVQGCGCRLSAKQKSPGSKCPAGFWGGEFDNKTTK